MCVARNIYYVGIAYIKTDNCSKQLRATNRILKKGNPKIED